MNMRNINVITALSVPGKTVSDDFMHAVLSNCATRIVLPAPEKFGSESLSSRSVNAGFLPLILQADQKYRISAITARLMLQIMSGRLTGH